MKFATFRLGKTSVSDIRTIDATSAGVLQQPLDITVSCTQLPEPIDDDTFVFVWLGSDNSKGIPTAWKQGFKAFGRVVSVERGERFNDESNTLIRILFVFKDAINRLDVLRDAPVEYYWCSALPVIGLDDHSNQTVRVLERKSELCSVEAFFTALNKVDGTFKTSICQIDNSFMELFGRSFKKPQPVEKPLREGFIDWLQKYDERVKTPKHAKEYADSYLYTINKDPIPGHDNPCANIWNDLYKFLYGKKAERDVFHVKGLADFQLIYGDIARIFAEEKVAGPFEVEKFEQAYDWAHAAGNKGHVRASYRAYVRYLEWREAQQKKDNAPVHEADLLSIALKIFAEKRHEEEWQGKTNSEEHQSIYSMSDLTPERLAEGSLDDFYNDFLLKVWVFKNGGSRKYAQLDDAEKTAYRQFVVDLKTQLKGFDAYFPPNTKCPAGMGVGMLTELMMRFWPKSCCSYNKLLIHDALVALGMAEGDFVWPKTPSIYQDFMGKCATILRKMEQMKLPRRPEPGNDEPPDYITVNEFLWFVHDYKDLIKETIMKKQLKPVNSKEKIKKGTRKLEDAFKDDEMLKRLAAALRTKPFAILAGHSGTGKSRLVRRLAYMTCNNELLIAEGAGKAAPGNYCMVQVKPNWHDSTDLLGYYSEMDGRHFVNTPFVQFICKAYAYPDTPFFVCLDEMNLAPVEQYFAEYLSAVESMEEKDGVWVTDPLVEIDKTGEKDAEGREKIDVAILEQIMKGAASTEAAEWIQKHGLTIPKNLFVVGTVNVDETTSQFPRKVLDRAMTLLMNEVRFADMAKSKSPSEEELLDETGLKFFLERDDRKVGERESKLLDGINAPLSNTPFMVAYRFGNEYALYEAALAKLDGVDLASADEATQDEIARRALDHVVMMKLLPRIHGEKVEVKNIFSGYDRKKEGGAAEHVDGLKNKLPSDGLSVAMMDKILARDDEYLTFWP